MIYVVVLHCVTVNLCCLLRILLYLLKKLIRTGLNLNQKISFINEWRVVQKTPVKKILIVCHCEKNHREINCERFTAPWFFRRIQLWKVNLSAAKCNLLCIFTAAEKVKKIFQFSHHDQLLFPISRLKTANFWWKGCKYFDIFQC